ncbi:MAG TPA: hypothetical protein VGI24_03775, partial [Solirubrobacteraceae bacterium]
PILAGVGYALWRVLTPPEERGALIALTIAAAGILLPLVLVAFGADYLAPRNLVGAMIPLTALIAAIVPAQRAGRVGTAFAALIALAFLAITVDVALSPRLQRGDWRGLAQLLRVAPAQASRSAPASSTAIPAGARAITTVELGAAPLEYYIPGLHNLRPGASVSVSEIDESGYSPLRASAGASPAPGFHLLERRDVHGLILYRFVSAAPRSVTEAALRRHVITEAHPEVLVAGSSAAAPAPGG